MVYGSYVPGLVDCYAYVPKSLPNDGTEGRLSAGGVVDSYRWMPVYQLAAVYGCEIVNDGNMTNVNNTSSLDLIANSMVSIRLSKKE